ncbi:hypothetical protein [Massilia sp. TWR1-2-2]|uniref:hypothetical protein n=1 Tax=Massilia sp. TWR1-2-2 TaxID=2804584 RepID=UPI003CEFAFB0
MIVVAIVSALAAGADAGHRPLLVGVQAPGAVPAGANEFTRVAAESVKLSVFLHGPSDGLQYGHRF